MNYYDEIKEQLIKKKKYMIRLKNIQKINIKLKYIMKLENF